jgi:TolA-binding protein
VVGQQEAGARDAAREKERPMPGEVRKIEERPAPRDAAGPAPPALGKAAEPSGPPIPPAPPPAGRAAAPALSAAPAAPPRERADAPSRSAPAPAAMPADERFSAAATAFATREYARAAEHFQAFLTEQPHDRRAAEARFYLAESLFALGRHREAAPLYAEFLAERPDHRHAVQALYREGLSRLAAGDQGGCPLLKRALERAPRAGDAAAAKEALARCK